MRWWHHSVRWAGLAFVALAAVPAAVAQELALAERGPRFLYASSAGARPQPVDVRRTPTLRLQIALELDGATLADALAEITRRSGLAFVYSRDEISRETRIHVRAAQITVAAALTEVLLDAGVDVLLSSGSQAALVRRTTAMMVQPGSVIGRVTDAKTGRALSDAEVLLEGTKWRTLTGDDGSYRLAEVEPGSYTLTARRIGYEKRALPVTVSSGEEATVDAALAPAPTRLEEVVVTGTMIPTEVKALPTPISVVTAEDIERQNVQRIDQLFRGQLPGAVAWDQGPYDYYSVISVRGASSLSFNGIKTYVDGVEVANSTYLATIDPSSVERIEVTRGPQASTLYGSEALSGVMQIFTKKGNAGLGRPQVAGKVAVGGAGGSLGTGTALETDNTLSVLGGSDRASYNLGGSFRHMGEWTPSYESSNWNLSAGAQAEHGPFTISGSARYSSKDWNTPWLAQFSQYEPLSQPPFRANDLRQQTFGVTAAYQAAAAWRHTLTLGYDQTRYDHYNTRPRFTTPADSLMSAASNNLSKASLLYHTDLSLRLGPAVSATLIGGVNYFSAPLATVSTSGATRTRGTLDGTTRVTRSTAQSTGYFGQAQVGVADRLFLTGGLRVEQNDDFGAGIGSVWSPRVGASYVLPVSGAELKLRGSYGEAIRAPQPGQRTGSVNPSFIYIPNPALRPERQRGFDGGVELYLGRRASLGVSYYNQRAVDLIQSVDLPLDPDELPTSQYQNVGEIKNEGWEFEGRLRFGQVTLSGTYSIVRSTIEALPEGYTGEYRVGDELIGIPHTAAGGELIYTPFQGTAITGSVTHISGWTNFDYTAYYAWAYGGEPYRGSDRAYWMDYPQVTKIGVGVSQVVNSHLTGFVRAENLGNNLRFEERDVNPPVPRRVIVGARLGY